MGNNGNLLAVDLFRNFFPNASKKQLAKSINKYIILQKYNESNIQQLST